MDITHNRESKNPVHPDPSPNLCLDSLDCSSAFIAVRVGRGGLAGALSAAASRSVTFSFSLSLISTPPITCIASYLRHAVVFHFPLLVFFSDLLPSRLVQRATLVSHLLPDRVSPSSLRHSFIYVTTTCISKPFPSSEEVLLFRPSAGTRGETHKAVRQPPDPPPSVMRKGKFTHLIGGESILGTGGVAVGGAGMKVVILVSGGSEVKRGRSHQ